MSKIKQYQEWNHEIEALEAEYSDPQTPELRKEQIKIKLEKLYK
jgi:hypothetical protein